MKLMIVDDSLVIRNKISRSVLARFTHVLRAEDGERAIALVRADRPDFITMDLTMPKIDGVEAIREIRKIEPEAKILVVSDLADKATAIQALTLGASGFLCKPFSEAELNSAIQRVLTLGAKS